MTAERIPAEVRPRSSSPPGSTSRRDAHPAGRRPYPATTTLRCLHADVALTERTLRLELRRARAQAVRGDQAWRERLQAYEHGDTLIVALTAHAVIDATGTDPHPQWPCCYCHEAVWIDRSTAAPALTDRLGALALRAFGTVAAGLRDRGITLGAREHEIAIELTVDPAISAQLRSPENDNADASAERHESANRCVSGAQTRC